MLVKKLMSKSVHSCKPGDTLAVAAEQMWRKDCGALPVCHPTDPQKVVGMVTDRDICMHSLFHQQPLNHLAVAGAMSDAVKTCAMTDKVQGAEQVMRTAGIRRLPVLDETGKLVGIISLADIAREAAKQVRSGKPEITVTEVTGTLSAICSPRGKMATAA